MDARSLLFVTDAEAETVLSACRVLTAVAARAGAATGTTLPADPAHFRILLAVGGAGGGSVPEVAAAAGLPCPTVTRSCEQLMKAGLIMSAEGQLPHGVLQVTAAGRDLLAVMLARRREALGLILGRLPAGRRRELEAVLRECAAPSDGRGTVTGDVSRVGAHRMRMASTAGGNS